LINWLGEPETHAADETVAADAVAVDWRKAAATLGEVGLESADVQAGM
jgi:hypothetical protein